MNRARGAQGGDRRQPARPVLSAYLIVVRLLSGGGGRLQTAPRPWRRGRPKLAGGRAALAAAVGFLTVALAGPAVSAPAHPATPVAAPAAGQPASPQPAPAATATQCNGAARIVEQATRCSVEQAHKGDPVAVVYYRCKLQGGKCTRPDDLYHVHNAVAADDLPVGRDGARVSHVSAWETTGPKIDTLHICGPEEVVTPTSGVTCHGDTKTDRWVVQAIHNYSGSGTPIAWMVSKAGTPEGPHNGAFKCFRNERSTTCDSDIRKVAGKGALSGTLKFWHFVNDRPDQGEDARTAKRCEKFTLKEEEATGSVMIVQRHV